MDVVGERTDSYVLLCYECRLGLFGGFFFFLANGAHDMKEVT